MQRHSLRVLDEVALVEMPFWIGPSKATKAVVVDLSKQDIGLAVEDSSGWWKPIRTSGRYIADLWENYQDQHQLFLNEAALQADAVRTKERFVEVLSELVDQAGDGEDEICLKLSSVREAQGLLRALKSAEL